MISKIYTYDLTRSVFEEFSNWYVTFPNLANEWDGWFTQQFVHLAHCSQTTVMWRKLYGPKSK